MVVTLAKNHGENPPRRRLQKNLSAVRSPPIPTDDLAGFELRASVSGIRAEAFRKTAMPLGYARLLWLMSGSQPDLYSIADV